MSYLETGVLVEADDSEDDKACSNGEWKSDHGQLAVVSCDKPATMAIDARKQSSMNSHSRASHFRLPTLAQTLCTQEQTTAVVYHDSKNSVPFVLHLYLVATQE